MSHMRSSHNYLILLLVSSASAFTLLAQQPASATNTSAPQATPTLLIQTDLDCTFTVDDGASVALLADVIKKMPIAFGEHLITAVTADRKDQWKTVVNADKPVQKVVVIELQKVRAAREKGEREAAQLEQDIKTKKEQAEKDGGETRDKATLQNAIKQRHTNRNLRLCLGGHRRSSAPEGAGPTLPTTPGQRHAGLPKAHRCSAPRPVDRSWAVVAPP